MLYIRLAFAKDRIYLVFLEVLSEFDRSAASRIAQVSSYVLTASKARNVNIIGTKVVSEIPRLTFKVRQNLSGLRVLLNVLNVVH